MKWIEFKDGCELPPQYRYVLVQLEEDRETGMPPAVCVAWLKTFSDGSDFITCGIGRKAKRKITHFCDCLGDKFHAPLWGGKQVK